MKRYRYFFIIYTDRRSIIGKNYLIPELITNLVDFLGWKDTDIFLLYVRIVIDRRSKVERNYMILGLIRNLWIFWDEKILIFFYYTFFYYCWWKIENWRKKVEDGLGELSPWFELGPEFFNHRRIIKFGVNFLKWKDTDIFLLYVLLLIEDRK